MIKINRRKNILEEISKKYYENYLERNEEKYQRIKY